MAFKDFNRNLSFADLELVGVLEKNRTQGFLEEINRTTDWPPAHRAYSSERPQSKRPSIKNIPLGNPL